VSATAIPTEPRRDAPPTLVWAVDRADPAGCDVTAGSVGLRALVAEANGVGHLVVDHRVLDTFSLAATALAATTTLRVVPVVDVAGQHPFLLARATATLDHVSRGRLALALDTTTAEPGLVVDVVTVLDELWQSWDPAAEVQDRRSGVFADPSLVRAVHHRGPHFSSRGPLNLPHAPQALLPLWARGPVPPALDARFDVRLQEVRP